MPAFRLMRNGQPLLQGLLDGHVSHDQVTDVVELQPYGFEIEDAEDDTDYRLSLGDDVADAPEEEHEYELGRRRTVFWEYRAWFESARGFVVLRVASRRGEEDEAWRLRLRMLVYARPTKVSEERYRGMSSALSGLSAGLLFDVVGKATRGTTLRRRVGRAPIQPPHLELQAIEAVWRDTHPDAVARRHAVTSMGRGRLPVGICAPAPTVHGR